MSCEPWQAKLEQYVDSELRGDEAVELEAHLRQCQSCAADALGRVRLKGMTHTAGKRFAPSPEFRLKIAQQVVQQKKPRLWGWRLGWRLAAVTAVLVAAISVSIFWTRHLQRERELGELADLHVATLASANPVDVISTDRHTVKPWFAGKLPFTFNLPELQNSPFQLVGGRMAYFEQSPGAQLLFHVRKHQLSVFIFS
jgi:anti-sigma factor RsiW